MEFSCVSQDDYRIIRVMGRMDPETAPEFEKIISSELSKGFKKLIIDLGGLTYISSLGLRSVLSSAMMVRANEAGISFCSAKGMVARVLSVAGFESLFKIHPDLEEALSG